MVQAQRFLAPAHQRRVRKDAAPPVPHLPGVLLPQAQLKDPFYEQTSHFDLKAFSDYLYYNLYCYAHYSNVYVLHLLYKYYIMYL